MATLQAQFKQFHDNIKLGTYEENQTLRDKRDLLINELATELKNEKVPDTDRALTFSKIDQGSYKMKTGIKPTDGHYDIDVGVIFDVTEDEYDPKKLKKLVYDIINKRNNRTVDYNKPCITVNYASGYHVDLPVYCKNSEKDVKIAWGKMTVANEWVDSDPNGLNDWVASISTESKKSRQFRKCVRYLKKWKQKHFSENGNVAPPSIGLTLQARRHFIFSTDNDLLCLINIVEKIINDFSNDFDIKNFRIVHSIDFKLPVKPYKNVYYKMTLNQQDVFYKKAEALLESLCAARDEDCDHEASKILRQVFGDDFPLVDKILRSDVKPVINSGTSA
ncbi:nucleotidyltransferase domain-containing protein [Shewanella salipaludis]|uniref:Cyclic GMP-AMP synthase n=1 Tax=Shewanella salipaludis TaxID=2723052 RepID=A0A972FZK1_9GAMM|nr:nucleotidyltransferase [Shewanella salipaludis]NMH64454.1 nucleotidyltransferase [Shewanella salipaludis]